MQKLQDLVWLWALLGFTVLPALKSWYQAYRRRTLIAKLEQARGTKVITPSFN